MPLTSRNQIDIKDAKIAFDGRTMTADTLTYTYDTPHSTKQAIGATIKMPDGETRASFAFEHTVTKEDIDFLMDLMSRETTFEITGRMDRGDGTSKDFVLPNCKLSSRSMTLAVGSTMSFSGECDKHRNL